MLFLNLVCLTVALACRVARPTGEVAPVRAEGDTDDGLRVTGQRGRASATSQRLPPLGSFQVTLFIGVRCPKG
jgi:hypothetical protein